MILLEHPTQIIHINAVLTEKSQFSLRGCILPPLPLLCERQSTTCFSSRTAFSQEHADMYRAANLFQIYFTGSI